MLAGSKKLGTVSLSVVEETDVLTKITLVGVNED